LHIYFHSGLARSIHCNIQHLLGLHVTIFPSKGVQFHLSEHFIVEASRLLFLVTRWHHPLCATTSKGGIQEWACVSSEAARQADIYQTVASPRRVLAGVMFAGAFLFRWRHPSPGWRTQTRIHWLIYPNWANSWQKFGKFVPRVIFAMSYFFGPIHVRALRESDAAILNRSGAFSSVFNNTPWTGPCTSLWFLLEPD